MADNKTTEDYDFEENVFDVGEPIHKKTISFTDAMNEALLFMADKKNLSVPQLIVSILEHNLKALAIRGKIPMPEKPKKR